MRWPLWVTCRHVWGNAGSSFIQRLFSCFSPTLLAFAYTTFVLTMKKTIKIKKNRMKGWRSRATPRLEEPAGLWLKQQQTRAEEKVCAIYITVASVIVCCHLNLSRRAKHARMLWWTASLGPWWLHSVAWCTSGAGRVCSGPGFALLLSWWVFTHTSLSQNIKIQPIIWLQLSSIDWQSDFGGSTCYVANDEDEEVGSGLRMVDVEVISPSLVFWLLSQLLTVYPEDNSLALVYRDKETLKFVKHINHKSFSDSANIKIFYDFSFVYFE